MNSGIARSMIVASKELDVFGRNDLFKYLRDKGILMDNEDRKNVPYQQYIKIGYFSVIEAICRDGKTRPQTFVYPKGYKFIIKLLKKDGYLKDKTLEELLDSFNKAS